MRCRAQRLRAPHKESKKLYQERRSCRWECEQFMPRGGEQMRSAGVTAKVWKVHASLTESTPISEQLLDRVTV